MSGWMAEWEPAPSRIPGREILEARELANERKLHDAGRPVALLADNQLGDAFGVGRRLALVGIEILAIDEDHDVGILLEGTRFAQVRELWPVIGPGLRRAAELRQHDDRDVQLLRQAFQRT